MIQPLASVAVLVESWLLRAARRRPDHEALVGPGFRLTYEQLRAEVDDAARRMATAGVRTGERVGVVLPPGREFVVTLHAILRLGAIAVPLDPQLPTEERVRRLAGAALTVTADGVGGETREPVEVAGGVGGTAGLSAGGAAGRPVELEVDPLGAGESQDELGTSPLLDTHDLDATAIVVHTSGTSGAAKPIPLTYGNWLWSAIGSAVTLGGPPSERWLCAMPLNHVGGLSVLLRSAIAATTAVVHERWDTDAVLAALTGEGPEGDGAGPDGGPHPRPTMVSLVPTTLRRLLDAGLRGPGGDPADGGARALRWVLLGGAAIPAGLLEDATAAGVPVAPT